MITINMGKINTLNSINDYKDARSTYENMSNFKIKCPKCGEEEYCYASSYERSLVIPNDLECGKNTIFINIKRVKFNCICCTNNGTKPTHALIPDFIIPHKQHSQKFIIEVLDKKESYSYKQIEEKYDVSKELLRFWSRCFKSIHKSYAKIITKAQEYKGIFDVILADINKFNTDYYQQFKLSFMQYTMKRIL